MRATTAAPEGLEEVTEADALDLAENLLPADRRELIDGYGAEPTLSIAQAVASGAGSCWCLRIGGRAAAIASVEDSGLIWLLCASVAAEHPLALARRAKLFVASRGEPRLWNWADLRNRAHLRLIAWLGFEFGQVAPFGPHQMPFVYFEKCSTPPR